MSIRCVKCKYWSIRAKLDADTTPPGPIIMGSCTKCDKNIIASDPYNGVPNWCPGYEVLGKIVVPDEEEVDDHMECISEEVNEAMNVKVDPTNPDHYKNHTSLECIEEMEIIFGSLGVTYFCVCNAWKYIRRWKNKNGIEDLKKAKWYIEKAWEIIDGGIVKSIGLANLLTRMSDYVDKWIKESEE